MKTYTTTGRILFLLFSLLAYLAISQAAHLPLNWILSYLPFALIAWTDKNRIDSPGTTNPHRPHMPALYPSFKALKRRDPIAGIDFAADATLCEDDYNFFVGRPPYSDTIFTQPTEEEESEYWTQIDAQESI